MPPQGDERSIRRKADIPPVQQSSHIALRAMADVGIGHYGLAFVGRVACARHDAHPLPSGNPPALRFALWPIW